LWVSAAASPQPSHLASQISAFSKQDSGMLMLFVTR
jgi:hypothetical protein